MSKPLVEITGFKELEAKLKLLSDDKDKKKEILLILRQVAKPTVLAAQSFVVNSKKPHKSRGKLIQPGNLKKSIGMITGKQSDPTIYVGARAKGVFNGWYGEIVHDGHNVYRKGFKRKRTKSDKALAHNNSGIKSRTTGNSFMTKAFTVTQGQVTADAEKKITAFIQRRIDKLSTNV